MKDSCEPGTVLVHEYKTLAKNTAFFSVLQEEADNKVKNSMYIMWSWIVYGKKDNKVGRKEKMVSWWDEDYSAEFDFR